MAEATLIEILSAREKRASHRASLSHKYKTPTVTLTMNIAGPVKSTGLIRFAFSIGIRKIREKIGEGCILQSVIDSEAISGPYAVFAVSGDAESLKKTAVLIEEESPLGRLFDIDVITESGVMLSRETERGCIVCGRAGKYCSAGRLHPLDEVVKISERILTEGVIREECNRISTLAVEALLEEVYTTPKPGLVDKNNNGSHTDMELSTFERSAAALKRYFALFTEEGIRGRELPYGELFDRLRAVGVLAERDMYSATVGVNTHKGVIFSFGIVCAAIGRHFAAEFSHAPLERMLEEAGRIASEAASRDFSTVKGETAGERMYLELGLGGIRVEAARGFPSVSETSLPELRSSLALGLCRNDAGVSALIHLIGCVDDTAIYNRGGKAGLEYARGYARELIERGLSHDTKSVREMDKAFIGRGLTAGGSADLLALTYFLDRLYESNAQT